jgi:hypothetical protein
MRKPRYFILAWNEYPLLYQATGKADFIDLFANGLQKIDEQAFLNKLAEYEWPSDWEDGYYRPGIYDLRAVIIEGGELNETVDQSNRIKSPEAIPAGIGYG